MTQTLALLGGGVIGGGWAARFLLNGWNVQVFDPDPEAPRKLDAVLAHARRTLPMLYDTAMPAEGALSFAPSVSEAVTGAALCIEAVPERLALKHQVYAEAQAANPHILIGSSTSGFKPSELAQGAADPARLAVTHPFNPVYLLPLVEVVCAAEPHRDALSTMLRSIGMYPLHVRKEIDAHIADRFLEAVWREALWLVKDGIATTEEIDNAIRYGFGLRWAQMGLFETYRLGGGEAGMAHFIAQFGPALKWPWTKLMDVPELTGDLVKTIAGQSDAQSGALDIGQLTELRDSNLVALLRALKQQDAAAGALIKAHEEIPLPEPGPQPLTTLRRTVPVDWTDYNGHMNESRYGQVFSDAADVVMRLIGADAAYIDAGNSYFTVETSTRFLDECHAADAIHVTTQVLQGEGKKLQLHHRMMRGETLCASCTQMLIHVSLSTRKSCPPVSAVAEKAAALAAAHAALPAPE